MIYRWLIPGLFFCASGPCFSQSPVLDAKFGSNGKTVTSFFSPGYSNGQKIALRADGGFYIIGSAAPKQNYHMAVASYLASGVLDSSYGAKGKCTFPFGDGSLRDHATCYYLDQDGLVLGGYATIESGELILALQRIKANGTLDSQWGKNGRVSQIFGYTSWVCGIYKLANKGLVVVGSSGIESNKPGIVVLKLDSTGKRDSAFGDNGVREIRTNWPMEALQSVADADGNIYLAGYYRTSKIPLVVRLNHNHSIDSSYGEYGYGIFPDSLPGKIMGLAIQKDQKLLAIGHTELFEKPVAALYRFFVNGAPDNLFAGSGKFVTSQSNIADFGRAVISAPDKSIYMVNMPLGEFQNGITSIVKLDSSGKKEVGFGNLGTFMRQFGNRADNPTDIRVDADNRLLVVGTVQTYSTLSGFYALRFFTDNSIGTELLATENTPVVFPNPSTGVLHFQNTGKSMQIRIRDGAGRLVFQSEINVAEENKSKVYLPKGIQPGMYFVEWGNSDKQNRQSVTIVSE